MQLSGFRPAHNPANDEIAWCELNSCNPWLRCGPRQSEQAKRDPRAGVACLRRPHRPDCLPLGVGQKHHRHRVRVVSDMRYEKELNRPITRTVLTMASTAPTDLDAVLAHNIDTHTFARTNSSRGVQNGLTRTCRCLRGWVNTCSACC